MQVPYGLQEEHMQEGDQIHHNTLYSNEQLAADQVTDWRVLDKFVASQLSQDDANNPNHHEASVQVSESMRMMQNELKRQDMVELTSLSTFTSSQVDLWK